MIEMPNVSLRVLMDDHMKYLTAKDKASKQKEAS